MCQKLVRLILYCLSLIPRGFTSAWIQLKASMANVRENIFLLGINVVRSK